MEDLRIGGIVSGMDTNSIVDTMVKRARISLDRMQGDYELKALEKSMYQDFSSKLTSLKTELLSMKLESTFKSKTADSSDPSVLTATASTNASVGSHTISIDQTATNAFSNSQFLRAAVYKKGAGIESVSGRPDSFIEGKHEVNVNQQNINGTDYFIGKDVFTPKNLGSFQQKTGGNPIANINDAGELTTGITGGKFSITVDSTEISTTIDAAAGDDINSVVQKIQSGLNDEINAHFSTTNVQYVTASSSMNTNTGEWKFSLSKTSLESFGFSINDTPLSERLGFYDAGSNITVTNSVTKIERYFAAVDENTLLNKFNSSQGGLVNGSVLKTANGGLTEGSFSIAQDSSLNVSAATPTKIFGNTVSSGGGLNTSVKGLQNANLLNAPSESTNGTFTINGTKINIQDYTQISVDELIGKINSSGAGVTASYNANEDRIELKSNYDGPGKISLGDISDTSDALSILRLSAGEGASAVLGTTDGYIDPSTKLSDSGMTAGISAGVFTINDVSIYVDPSKDSLNDVIYKVNNSGANVTMSYDSNTDKVTVRSNGVDKVSFGSPNDSSNFLEAVNLTDNTLESKSLGKEGRYAVLNIDGVDYVRKENKIDDIIDGVTLNLNNVSSGFVNLNINVDTDKAVETTAKFIQHYNTLMEKLSPPEIEDQDKEYLEPLTDEKKSQMTDSEVEEYQKKWEEFNQYRMINRSSELRSLRTTLRSNLLNQVPGINGDYQSLSEIGLDIAGDGNIEIEKKGMLLVDSTDLDEIKDALKNNVKFNEALSTNPDDVYNLFAQDNENGRGWARLYEEKINQYTSSGGMIANKIGPYGSIDRSMMRIMEQMTREEERMNNKMDRLWREFSRMEEQISQIQSQGDYMMQMLQSTK